MMAQTFYHQAAHSGSQSVSNYSHLSVTESKDNDTDSKDDCDDDVLRYNKRLKERRDRLLEELTRLEDENKTHCDKLRDLLKPLQLINKEKNKKKNSKQSNKKIDDAIAAQMSKYSDDEYDEYEEKLKTNALDGIEEFKIPQINDKMDDEQKKDFLSLLIRYLCLANNYQRNEIKSLYAKQTSLYFQAQGLSLDEQRQFLETLSRPIPAFQPIEKQKNGAIQQLLAKFPDPHDISEHYEKYTKLIKDINLNAPDTDTNWQTSVIKSSIDELQSSMSSNIPSTPQLANKYSSNYSQSHEDSNNTPTKPTHRPKKSGLFGFRRKKSVEKVAYAVDIKQEHSIETAPENIKKESLLSTTSSTENATSPRSISYETQKAVAMMGSQANAPTIASTSRNTAISGARLIRFDANYKQLQSRRQRCDIASVVAALQNTHHMHSKMKQRVPNANGENPFLSEQNFGFDQRYSNANMYTYDTILDDADMLRTYKEESQKNNAPMTPAMNSNAHSKSNTNSSIPSLALNNGHLSAQSTIREIQGWEALLSPEIQSSSRNLHSIINSNGFPDTINVDENKQDSNTRDSMSSCASRSRKWSHENLAQVFTQVSRPIMNVNKEKSKSRPGWITLSQFIHLATNFGAHGLRDAQVLVLTHKIFCQSKSLLKGLRARFWMPMPPNITPTEMSAFRQTYVKQIRGKIIAVLRYWLTKHWCDDFRDDFSLQHRMNKFIKEIHENKESESMCTYLALAFEKEKKANAINTLLDDRKQLRNKQQKKVIKFFYDTKTMDILDFKPEETAACIVELNCKSFLLIDQRECFEWIKHKEKAPHVASMIARWNAMGNWVQRELLSIKKGRDFKKRLQCLRYFIQIVSILADLGDFSGAYAINSALHSTPVHRLKSYFDELTRKEHQTLTGMRQLFTVSGNYPNLRAKMKHYLSKPCVPHIGLFTRDLTMLAETKSIKMINNKKYINFGQCQTLAKQIGDLKMYQNNINKFNLKYQKPLLDYVETQLENAIKSENDLYKMSIQVEPKATNV